MSKNQQKTNIILPENFNAQGAAQEKQEQKTYLWFSRNEANRFHAQIMSQFPQGAFIDESVFENISVQLPAPEGQKTEPPATATLNEDLLSYDIAVNKANGQAYQYTKATNSPTPPKGYKDYQLAGTIDNADIVKVTNNGALTEATSKNFGISSLTEIEALKTQVKNFYEPWKGYISAPVPDIDDSSEAALGEIQNLIGLDGAKKRASEYYHLASLLSAQAELGLETDHPITNLVISGERGTGKNTYAEYMAKAYKEWNMVHNDTYIEVTSDQILGEYMGNTDAMIKAKLQEAEGGIIHIKITDNIYASNLTGRDYGQEIVNALTKPLQDHQHHATVFISGQTDVISELLDSANGDFISEVKTVYIEPFSEKDLNALLKKTFKESHYSITPAALKAAEKLLIETKNTVPENQFSNGHTVNQLFKAMVRKLATRLAKNGDTKKVKGKDHDLMVKKLTQLTVEDVKGITPASITKADANKKTRSAYSTNRIGFGAILEQNKQTK